MKIGLKIYNQKDFFFVKRFMEEIDFIEVMSLQKNDYSFLYDIDFPFMIHSEHFMWGVNFTNPHRFSQNKKSLDYSINLANKINAKFIIIHPELIEDDSCSEEVLISFLKEFSDRRILVESMPKSSYNMLHIGYDFESLKRISMMSKNGICLDIPHSCETAYKLKEEQIGFIKKLLSLRPMLYHLSDTKIGEGVDMHLNLEEGNLPLSTFLKLIPQSSWITLETPHLFEKTKKDINFLRML